MLTRVETVIETMFFAFEKQSNWIFIYCNDCSSHSFSLFISECCCQDFANFFNRNNTSFCTINFIEFTFTVLFMYQAATSVPVNSNGEQQYHQHAKNTSSTKKH